jgi:flagellar biosynthesis/type III secretory pathway chaperone
MNAPLEKLYDLLCRERDIHDRLIETATTMNTMLKEHTAESIRECSAQYDEYIYQIEQCEAQRLEVCDILAKQLVPHKRHINITDIIHLLEEQDRERFAAVRAELSEKMKQLSKINTSNQIWLEEALNHMSRTVSILTRAKSYVSGYKKKGEINQQLMPSSIINKKA